MDGRNSGIIVDLATDNSSKTISQIITAVNAKLTSLPSFIVEKPLEVYKHEFQNSETKLSDDSVSEKERIHFQIDTGNFRSPSQCHVILLSKTNVDEPPNFPSSQVFVSDDYLDLLFKAKIRLDESPGFGCDIQVVTTTVMKKFWETACLHIFSPVTTWSVLGVPVVDQAVTLREPLPLSQVENTFREYLKTVGNSNQVNIWRSDIIPVDQFNAGFHDRCGGASQLSTVASMNMVYTPYKPDPVLLVEENKRRLAVAAGFDPDLMHVAKAEHAKTIWVVGKEQPARYDGIVTNQPGVTVCAPGADCCMILLADTFTGAVGALHAGWKGTSMMAVSALIDTMKREFNTQPVNIRATIGPAVSSDHFLLKPEDAKPVTDLDPSLTWASKEKPDLVHINLVQANVVQLIREGVSEHYIDTKYALCTFENKQFFSYERDGKPFGNQVGFISCRKKKPDLNMD